MVHNGTDSSRHSVEVPNVRMYFPNVEVREGCLNGQRAYPNCFTNVESNRPGRAGDELEAMSGSTKKQWGEDEQVDLLKEAFSRTKDPSDKTKETYWGEIADAVHSKDPASRPQRNWRTARDRFNELAADLRKFFAYKAHVESKSGITTEAEKNNEAAKVFENNEKDKGVYVDVCVHIMFFI